MEQRIAQIYERLLPCPFCGGKPLEKVWMRTDEGNDHWEIKCDCGCKMRHDREDKTIAMWNNRIDPNEPDEDYIQAQLDSMYCANCQALEEHDCFCSDVDECNYCGGIDDCHRPNCIYEISPIRNLIEEGYD